MKIAFASEHPNEIGSFSGVPCYMFQALHAASESITYIETPSYDLATILSSKEEGLRQLETAGKYLSSRLEKMNIDVLICQGSSMIPFLKTDVPVILWHDATWFGQMQMGFEKFKIQHPLLYEWDCMVLERCDLIFFAADWVRDQTLEYYEISPHKIHTIPFGANVLPYSMETTEAFIYNRQPAICQLTFLGVDWRRKGLATAYEVCMKLNERGIPSQLNVIGCNVDIIGIKRKIKHYSGYQPFTEAEKFQLKFHKSPYINNLGFLQKGNPADYAKLGETLQNSHFLLHPASFECFGIALAEANAFGVPVIATNCYGPKTIIRNGANGYLFDSDEYVECASALIQEQMKNYEKYRELALRSFLEQQDRLDWARSVKKLFQVVSEQLLVH